jgi:predicted ATP-grasp superfamily ATP-dependent carboligase
LQTARVFAARGIDVIGIAANLRHPCVRTKSCRRVIPSKPDSESIVATLRTLGPQLDIRAVLVPCTDLAVLGVARHRDELKNYFLMSVPDHPVIEQLMDKARFAEFAGRKGLPIPPTHVVRTRKDAETTALEARFPCVLKPSVKSVAWDTNAAAKALIAESPAELLALYDHHAQWAEAFVVQEWIPGGDSDHYTCDSYSSANGEPLVTFSSRKIRQWPPVVGQGCLSIEHRNDEVRDEAIRALTAAGHHGHGYVEMKWDASAGRHLIIEANVGRPTGRSAAAERAGVELLMTMYCDLVGDPLPAERVQHYRGAKWIHIRRDLQASAYAVLTGRSRARDILRSWRGPFAFALFSLRDPGPFVVDMLGGLRRAARRGLRFLASPAGVRRVGTLGVHGSPLHEAHLSAPRLVKVGFGRLSGLRRGQSVEPPVLPSE